MRILKFGGSSVANTKNINKVIDIILHSLKQGDNLVVVVSALDGITDNLIELATFASKKDKIYKTLFKSICQRHNEIVQGLTKRKNQKKILKELNGKYRELEAIARNIFLTGKLSLRSLDAVISFGEQLSAYIIGEGIKNRGVSCKFTDARTFIKTNNNFGEAEVNTKDSYKLILSYFKNNTKLSIIGGFIASTKSGITTTLGRGGSDYTAALIGGALNASAIEIWTDVDGLMTADPRKVKDAFPIPEISYEEAEKMAHLGAKVIHHKTMKPARLKNIPIYIKNTFNPKAPGTKIISRKVNSKNFNGKNK